MAARWTSRGRSSSGAAHPHPTARESARCAASRASELGAKTRQRRCGDTLAPAGTPPARSVGRLAFGQPLRYLPLRPHLAEGSSWDDALERAAMVYTSLPYNILTNNCHQYEPRETRPRQSPRAHVTRRGGRPLRRARRFVAHSLNVMGYQGRRSWEMASRDAGPPAGRHLRAVSLRVAERSARRRRRSHRRAARRCRSRCGCWSAGGT